MKPVITEIEADAILASEEGGQGLYLYDRKRCGKLYDGDRARLVQAVLASGVSLSSVKVLNDAELAQHIEVDEEPLEKLFMLLEPKKPAKKKSRKTVKIEKDDDDDTQEIDEISLVDGDDSMED